MATTKKAAKKTTKKSSSAKSRKSTPKKLTDVELVKASAAAPHASLAGTETVLEIDGCPLKITVIDGARAKLEINEHELLSQAQLQEAGKLLNSAIQGTY